MNLGNKKEKWGSASEKLKVCSLQEAGLGVKKWCEMGEI